MEEYSVRLWLENSEGEEKEYELVGTFQVEEKFYMALLPVEEETEGVVLTRFREGENDSVLFEPIEDDEEYQLAADVYEQLFNGEFNWEEEEEPLLDDDYCYEDREGRLFIFGGDGERIYLDQWGEPITESTVKEETEEVEEKAPKEEKQPYH